ncbi:glycosyltransferase [Empedobacter stercoris]|uniref:glycosyltransferase n=1 Tax=Empedobacter stercoris TaxID=1628248 RepID=UPI0021AF89EA|nr:glycosyltransferase [Empedobacter stercoris]UWX66026.1 glycosyltransferase [Empedobacter stercoris]
MKAVFLIANYVPHQLTSMNTLVEEYKVNILSYSISEKFKYVPEKKENFQPILFKDQPKKQVYQDILKFNPSVLVVAGWMIKDYVWIAKQIKKNTKIKVVAMSDTPWYGTLKQKINAWISPLHLKKAFDYLWVAGFRQYDYARKLGFANNQIIFNSLSADNKLFHHVEIERKKTNYPKNFLYVGRFAPEKGLNILLEAWEKIQDKQGWTLTLIGDGPLKNEFIHREDIKIKDYMAHDELLMEMQNAGCFVLPSLHEPWALVIHEAACAGLPIICTEVCGAAPHFVIDKFNGFQVNKGDSQDLANKIVLLMNHTDKELIEMSTKSRVLSNRISPDITVASLLVIN